jgi:hypothetical protein
MNDFQLGWTTLKPSWCTGRFLDILILVSHLMIEFYKARPLLPDQLPEEDARLVDAGMKRGLEDPTPNERVTNKSKIFGMWRADDLTELGDCKSA